MFLSNIPYHYRFQSLVPFLSFCSFVESRWLQPDSYADPQKTSLILNKDDIRCGWPATVVVQTKDQYGDVVHVPNMKVRIMALAILKQNLNVSIILPAVSM